MESGEDRLEKGLLSGLHRNPESRVEDDEEDILYTASFVEGEEDFVKYQTAWWLLYSMLLVLVWGIGLLMLAYLPVRRYVSRKDIRSRKLYLTHNAIVYKVTKPVSFPCFGVVKKEMHILLPSVADVVVEQGFLQSSFNVYSVRIENVGVRRPPSDDFHIQGLTNPEEFREAVLARLSNSRDEALPRHADDVATPRTRVSSIPSVSASKSPGLDSLAQLTDAAVLEKLDEVCSNVKKIETLIQEQTRPTARVLEY